MSFNCARHASSAQDGKQKTSHEIIRGWWFINNRRPCGEDASDKKRLFSIK
jgi:hypothetical protein